MLKLIAYFAANVFVVIVLSNILSNFKIDTYWVAALFVIVLAVLNYLITPVLKFFALPFNLITFGLVNLLINLGAVYVTTELVHGIHVTGAIGDRFVTIIIVAVALFIINTLIERFFDNEERE